MLKLAQLGKQKIYQLLKYTNGNIIYIKKPLKGITVWLIYIIINKKRFKLWYVFADSFDELSIDEVKHKYTNIVLNKTLYNSIDLQTIEQIQKLIKWQD